MLDLLVQKEAAEGVRNQDIDEAAIPSWASELWSFFLALHVSRGAGFDGVLPISPSEIESLARLYNVELTPWEVETVISLDDKVRKLFVGKQKERRE